MDQEVEVCTMTLSLTMRRAGLSMDHDNDNDNEKRGLVLFTGTQVPSGNVSTFDLRIGGCITIRRNTSTFGER